jgi:hypothetical protein
MKRLPDWDGFTPLDAGAHAEIREQLVEQAEAGYQLP